MLKYIVCFGVLAAAIPSLACEVVFRENVDPNPVFGDACSVSYELDEVSSMWTSEARDLGQGFVVQNFNEGDGCGHEESTSVFQCESGHTLFFGSDSKIFWLLSDPTNYDLLTKQIEDEAANGRHLALENIHERAKNIDRIQSVLIENIPGQVDISNKNFDLSCGCKLFYPEIYEASQ